MSKPTGLPIPDEYDSYVQRLADKLEAAGLVDIDGRAAVLIAAVNLLDELLAKIPVDTDEESKLRLQVLAELAEIQELSD